MAWQCAQTNLQVKWSSICNELHIDETPHYFYLVDSRYLQDKVKCWLTWQEVKQKQTTYLGILNEAGNNNNNFGNPHAI